jgi:hypothetical protein
MANFRERLILIVVLAGFVACAALVYLWLPGHPDSSWRLPAALSPLVAVLILAWIAIRRVARLDELRRKIVTEALAFAFIAMAISLLTYGFLDEAGLPALDPWWVWLGMSGFWGLGWLLSWRRYR